MLEIERTENERPQLWAIRLSEIEEYED